jgi:archaellum component FlaC
MTDVDAPAVPADDECRVRELLYGARRQARASLDAGHVDVAAAEEPVVLMRDREPPAGPEPDRPAASGLGRLRRAREERRRRLAQELVLQQNGISGPRAGTAKTVPAEDAGDPQLALAAAEERAAAVKGELEELRGRYSAEVEHLARIAAEALARAEAAERRLAATRELVQDLSKPTVLAVAEKRQLRKLHDQLERERQARLRLAREAAGHVEEMEHKAERLTEGVERIAKRSNQLERERQARLRLAREAAGHLEEMEHTAERLAEGVERIARRSNQLEGERRARLRLAREAAGHLEEVERLAERAKRIARRRFEEASEPPPLDVAGAELEPGEVGPRGRTVPRRRSPAA